MEERMLITAAVFTAYLLIMFYNVMKPNALALLLVLISIAVLYTGSIMTKNETAIAAANGAVYALALAITVFITAFLYLKLRYS